MGLAKILLVVVAALGVLLAVVWWGREEVTTTSLDAQRPLSRDAPQAAAATQPRDAPPASEIALRTVATPNSQTEGARLAQGDPSRNEAARDPQPTVQQRTPQDTLLSQCPVRLPAELHPSSVMRSMLFFGPKPTAVQSRQHYLGLPSCPMGGARMDAHEDDANEDQRASHIQSKYRFYASRCNLTAGIMWAHMTPSVMEEVTRRVSNLAHAMTVVRPSSEEPHPAQRSTTPFSVLDWASGCGAGAPMLQRAMRTAFGVAKTAKVEVLGIELVDDAVAHARRHFAGAGISFCQADGTKLRWIDDGQFDIAVSFGGLLHLPSAVMCATIEQLLHKIKPNGILWTGYVDNPRTAEALARCADVTNRTAFALCPEFSEPTDDVVPLPVYPPPVYDTDGQLFVGTHVYMLRENVWLKNIGMPRVYRRKKPLSILWRKVGW